MDLEPWQLIDPSRLISEIADRVRLLSNTAHLAVVEDASTQQVLTQVETLPTPARIGHYLQVQDLLRRTMRERLPIPSVTGPGMRHTVVTVIVREGLAVFGRNEERWLLAWRYSNHLMGAFQGTTFLVTEHGWYDWASTWGDREPHLVPASGG
jgi:hypothetical protein